MNLEQIFERIQKERERQEDLHPVWHPMSALQVLVEEVGEVAHAQLEGDPDNLEDELIQVAAVAIRWLENR